MFPLSVKRVNPVACVNRQGTVEIWRFCGHLFNRPVALKWTARISNNAGLSYPHLCQNISPLTLKPG